MDYDRLVLHAIARVAGDEDLVSWGGTRWEDFPAAVEQIDRRINTGILLDAYQEFLGLALMAAGYMREQDQWDLSGLLKALEHFKGATRILATERS
jgi:hypothetical protein